MKKRNYIPYSLSIIHNYWRGNYFGQTVDDFQHFCTSIKLSKGLVLYATMMSPEPIDYDVIGQLEDLHLHAISYFRNPSNAYIFTDYRIRVEILQSLTLKYSIYTNKGLIYKTDGLPMIISVTHHKPNELHYRDQALVQLDSVVDYIIQASRCGKIKRLEDAP